MPSVTSNSPWMAVSWLCRHRLGWAVSGQSPSNVRVYASASYTTLPSAAVITPGSRRAIRPRFAFSKSVRSVRSAGTLLPPRHEAGTDGPSQIRCQAESPGEGESATEGTCCPRRSGHRPRTNRSGPVLLATLLLFSDDLTVMPLVIVAVVAAHVAAARISPTGSAAAAPA